MKRSDYIALGLIAATAVAVYSQRGNTATVTYLLVTATPVYSEDPTGLSPDRQQALSLGILAEGVRVTEIGPSNNGYAHIATPGTKGGWVDRAALARTYVT